MQSRVENGILVTETSLRTACVVELGFPPRYAQPSLEPELGYLAVVLERRAAEDVRQPDARSRSRNRDHDSCRRGAHRHLRGAGCPDPRREASVDRGRAVSRASGWNSNSSRPGSRGAGRPDRDRAGRSGLRRADRRGGTGSRAHRSGAEGDSGSDRVRSSGLARGRGRATARARRRSFPASASWPRAPASIPRISDGSFAVTTASRSARTCAGCGWIRRLRLWPEPMRRLHGSPPSRASPTRAISREPSSGTRA